MDANSAFVNTVARAGRASRQDEIVVFWIIRDSACAECGEELGKGRFLRIETERPLCLRCADLDHLVFLERGDAALTRRASRYSTLRAVVVRFSRSRKRYERQGVLVEEQALARAEQECLSDLPEVLGSDWSLGGGEGATGNHGRSCRSSSRSACPHTVRRTSRKWRVTGRSSRAGSRIDGEMPRHVAARQIMMTTNLLGGL